MNRPREISALFNLQSIPETLEMTESKDTTTVRLFVGLIKAHELPFRFQFSFLINSDKTFHFYFMVDGSATVRAKLERNEPIVKYYEFRNKTHHYCLCVSVS